MTIIYISTFICVITGFYSIYWVISILSRTEDKYIRNEKKKHYVFLMLKPFILLLASINQRFIEEWCNIKYKKLLVISGNPYKIIPVEFYAIKELSALFGFCFTFIMLSYQNVSIWIVLIISIIFFFLPDLWLKEVIYNRKQKIFNSISFYIDYLTLSVKSGLDFLRSMEEVVRNGSGPLREEFELLLIDLNTDPVFRHGLEKFQFRCDMNEIKSFVSALIQAKEKGTDITTVLETQAEIRRDERYKKAEVLAEKAPVKMIFPIVFLIMPAVFLIILVPIILKYFAET